jgi:hypothetical protein
MNDKVQAIINRYSLGVDAGPRFASKLTILDKRILDSWLAKQRLETNPDNEIWIKLLLSDKPFFFSTVSSLIKGRRSVIIKNCSTELDLSQTPDISLEFPLLSHLGLRFLLRGVDSRRIRLYGGEKPVLVDMHDQDCIWSIGSSGNGSFCLKNADCREFVTILLREWKQAFTHYKQAREMLCDLFSTGLAQS